MRSDDVRLVDHVDLGPVHLVHADDQRRADPLGQRERVPVVASPPRANAWATRSTFLRTVTASSSPFSARFSEAYGPALTPP